VIVEDVKRGEDIFFAAQGQTRSGSHALDAIKNAPEGIRCGIAEDHEGTEDLMGLRCLAPVLKVRFERLSPERLF
jgi:hypothetical protein